MFVALTLVIRVPRPDGTGADLAFDAEMGWAPKASEKQRAAGLEVHRDVVGQRQEVLDHSRDHVLVFGDSVVFGMGLEANETIAARLDAKMKHHQVLNAGITGTSIDHTYLYLQRLLPRTRAKLVVVGIFGGNDYQGLTESQNYGHSKPIFRIDGGGLVLTRADRNEFNCINHLSKTLFMHALWLWSGDMGDGRREAVARGLASFCGEIRIEADEGKQVTEALLAGIAAETRARGARLLYLLLPTAGDFDDPRIVDTEYYKNPWPGVAFFRGAVERGGYDFIDLRDVFLKSRYCERPQYRGSPCDVHAIFLDGGHLAAEPSDLAADAVRAWAADRYGLN